MHFVHGAVFEMQRWRIGTSIYCPRRKYCVLYTWKGDSGNNWTQAEVGILPHSQAQMKDFTLCVSVIIQEVCSCLLRVQTVRQILAMKQKKKVSAITEQLLSQIRI